MNDQIKDAKAVATRAQEWINAMQIAGMTENAIVTGLLQAITERALRAGGVERTSRWLRNHADFVDMAGPDLLRELGN